MLTTEERLAILETRLAELEQRLSPQRPSFEDMEADGYEEPEIDYDEQRERKEEEIAGNCKCGAWQFTPNRNIIHVADCCCGAE